MLVVTEQRPMNNEYATVTCDLIDIVNSPMTV